MNNQKPAWWAIKRLWDHENIIFACLLGIVMLTAIFLRFYNLGEAGYGNMYYAAAVKSMLISWKNFFLVAFEPGGSVSVDKPPVGFWAQAVSAYFFGVNGFALALPNALAGVFSTWMIFILVRDFTNKWAGLLAAVVMAITPIAIATERNNTIDGLLVFILLLAAWNFTRAARGGKTGWLLLGAALVGVGFNIKMLQAFLPLPAFYAVYWWGAKLRWKTKLFQLSAASILLAVISLSWALVVDLTPANQRPYVDSSANNSVMSLIFGHNGLTRLTNAHIQVGDDKGGLVQLQPPSGGGHGGQPPMPPGGPGGNQGQPPAMGKGGPPGGGGSMDFGSAGTLRLFTSPLADEASWLLPFALGGLAMMTLMGWKSMTDGEQIALVLWAGWLIPEMLYFSYSGGLMHAYYLIMLAPPLAAMTAMSTWWLWKQIQINPRKGLRMAFLLSGATLLFQGITLWSGTMLASWLMIVAGLFFSASLGLAAFGKPRWVLALLMISLLVAPAAWSTLTTLDTNPNGALPNSGPVQNNNGQSGHGPGGPGGNANIEDNQFLNYLLANTAPDSYLLATERSNDAAPYILATGRPVLTFGGFLGQYQVVTIEQVATLVTEGKLRFILGNEKSLQQNLATWVQQNCTQVNNIQLPTFGENQDNTLWDCRVE
jgi:4-amino-4-deoxy-L-arabinose transferase-like glycosyltransferase